MSLECSGGSARDRDSGAPERPFCASRTPTGDCRLSPWAIGRPSSGSELASLYCSVVMDEHPNATAYRRTADAFRAGDLARLEELIDPDVVWHVPGSHPMAGDVLGRTNLMQWLRQLNRRGFWLTEEDVFGSDDHVCALSIMGATRPGIDTERESSASSAIEMAASSNAGSTRTTQTLGTPSSPSDRRTDRQIWR